MTSTDILLTILKLASVPFLVLLNRSAGTFEHIRARKQRKL